MANNVNSNDMKKICSLDFLNRDKFSANVYSENGVLIFKEGSRITPNILLMNYFKKLYIKASDERKFLEIDKFINSNQSLNVNSGVVEGAVAGAAVGSGIGAPASSGMNKGSGMSAGVSAESDLYSEDSVISSDNSNIISNDNDFVQNDKSKNDFEMLNLSQNQNQNELPSKYGYISDEDSDVDEEVQKKEPFILGNEDDSLLQKKSLDNIEKSETNETNEEELLDLPLEFNEDDAEKMAELSKKIAIMFNYTPKEIEEISKATYYKNVSMSKFKQSDAKLPNFMDKIGNMSYDIMKNELQLPEAIAEVAKLCTKKYDVKYFQLTKNKKPPYYHLVSIVDFYFQLMRTMDKESAIQKMVKIGSNKFNTFILHKFINIIREDFNG